jgi:repressor LexA
MEAWTGSLAGEVQFEWCEVADVPLLGVVAAGEPYQAFPVEETLTVPTALWGGKQVFALRVRGSSMIDEGIHNGDYLIVEPRQTAENGQTVVAEVEDGVTVKKYYREPDGSVRLQPANPEMLPLTFRGDHVRIIGIVAGIVRKLGFGDKRPARTHGGAGVKAFSKPPRPAPVDESASLELAVNVMDSQLVRWRAAIEHARRDKRLQHHLPQMEDLCRDLEAVRDWCARTRKPSLRRALTAEANKVMRRMQRFAALTPVALPDLVLH